MRHKAPGDSTDLKSDSPSPTREELGSDRVGDQNELCYGHLEPQRT